MMDDKKEKELKENKEKERQENETRHCRSKKHPAIFINKDGKCPIRKCKEKGSDDCLIRGG